MSRVIFHVDVNSAFLSWSAAYRVRVLGEREDLRDIPSAVAGERAERHGIILAKSIPAKKCGVKTGEQIFLAQQKCPGLKLVPPDYALYVQASRRFIALLREFAPVVEQYSIDEAWADLSGTEGLYGSPVAAAELLRTRIREELGFTVNIGISSNKLLAKMAGEFEKPDKVHTLFPEEVPQKLWPLPVRKLFMLGPATERRLNRIGIHTIGELAQADPELVLHYLNKPGLALWHSANGRCSEELLPQPEANKGYGNSTTLPADVTTEAGAQRVLLSLCETVALRLRRDGKAARCISVSLRSADFVTFSHQTMLREACTGRRSCSAAPAGSLPRHGTGRRRCASSACRPQGWRSRSRASLTCLPWAARSSMPARRSWMGPWMPCAKNTARASSGGRALPERTPCWQADCPGSGGRASQSRWMRSKRHETDADTPQHCQG